MKLSVHVHVLEFSTTRCLSLRVVSAPCKTRYDTGNFRTRVIAGTCGGDRYLKLQEPSFLPSTELTLRPQCEIAWNHVHSTLKFHDIICGTHEITWSYVRCTRNHANLRKIAWNPVKLCALHKKSYNIKRIHVSFVAWNQVRWTWTNARLREVTYTAHNIARNYMKSRSQYLKSPAITWSYVPCTWISREFTWNCVKPVKLHEIAWNDVRHTWRHKKKWETT